MQIYPQHILVNNKKKEGDYLYFFLESRKKEKRMIRREMIEIEEKKISVSRLSSFFLSIRA